MESPSEMTKAEFRAYKKKAKFDLKIKKKSLSLTDSKPLRKQLESFKSLLTLVITAVVILTLIVLAIGMVCGADVHDILVIVITAVVTTFGNIFTYFFSRDAKSQAAASQALGNAVSSASSSAETAYSEVKQAAEETAQVITTNENETAQVADTNDTTEAIAEEAAPAIGSNEEDSDV
jgi:ABC-type transport system involved in cytochrome bd biosynthesis fused ATPase/permease subunit